MENPFIEAFQPYFRDGSLLLLCLVLIATALALLNMAWRARQATGGISYVWCVFSIVTSVFALLVYTQSGLNLWVGLVGLFWMLGMAVRVILAIVPTRRR
ncbi:hypothetical protein K7W42_22205 [Deinococcus sp. HMF7604]|uniref:hypothetical protein n=1 Tax=Deinococcus betulae TaxID=2873312 RepID=UPI001CC929A9|nr:hypothetical protein [Deinococcus betulae]MBZ9753549.1 hypothetical protein [Deinococcus betulae]